MRILIMGLPGAGKTHLAKRLQIHLNCAWYNADKVREMANDWDFSDAGRRRQSERMNTLAMFEGTRGRTVICDFVCPTGETRKQFSLFSSRIDHGKRLQERVQKISFIEESQNSKSNEKHSSSTYGESRSREKGRR